MLAGDASTSGVVKSLSEFNRLAVNASVQVGEHQTGAGSCLASGGSGGIVGGFTGNEAGDVLAQLASSALQVSTASRKALGTLALFFGRSHDSSRSTLLFIACSALGLLGCLCDCFHLLCMICPQLLNLRVSLPAAHLPSRSAGCRPHDQGKQENARAVAQPSPPQGCLSERHTSPA